MQKHYTQSGKIFSRLNVSFDKSRCNESEVRMGSVMNSNQCLFSVVFSLSLLAENFLIIVYYRLLIVSMTLAKHRIGQTGSQMNMCVSNINKSRL